MDSLKKLCILLVEDHKIAQKMAMMAIKQFDSNLEIDTADTGSEAITQFEKNHYDLIFMDLGLPDTDGYAVTETIRKLEVKNNTHTPIVALTAHTDYGFQEQAIKVGMDDFLSKPLTVDKIKKIFDKYA